MRYGTLFRATLRDVTARPKTAARVRAERTVVNDTEWDEFEPEQARLRALVQSVDKEITAAFSRDAAAQAPRLAHAWQRLVSGLALHPAPELRRCPFCARRVPSIATRCRYCLKSSDATLPAGALPAPSAR